MRWSTHRKWGGCGRGDAMLVLQQLYNQEGNCFRDGKK